MKPARGAIALLALAGAAAAQPAGPGLQQNLVFTAYSPLSANATLAHRAISPLAAVGLEANLSQAGVKLAEQAVDLKRERFVAYVPQNRPANGYGLIVFVPPWPRAEVPKAWTRVLDSAGVIFVSAANSGNDASVLGRREPLAVLAATNAMARYRVDPQRVYVAGLSGGSRVAMKLALAYPDLFRGAILNAGSDPVGEDAPLPPADLMRQVQERSRLIYVTGAEDSAVLADDAASQASLRAVCMFNLEALPQPGMGHDLAPAPALERALTLLDQPAAPDPKRLADCREAVAEAIAAKLGAVESLLAAGQRRKALSQIVDVDRRWGGLAAPRSVQLFKEAASP
ncbi:MAG TPA: PHB depolymerase family esterase [Caulobacteraceae bacterium]|nr:PHB depolymerase family esterase [Caulobacteraceae bacterium]